MFILRKNLSLFLKNYTKNVSLSVPSKTDNVQCRQTFPSQFCFGNYFSSHAIENPIPENNTIQDENKTSCISQADIEAITKGDKELEHKLKVIILETEVLRQDGKSVPSNEYMTAEIWENMLKLPSRSGRTKYLDFLFRTSKKKHNKLVKKLEKRKTFEEHLANKELSPKSLPIEEHALKYGLLFNNIFIRFNDSTMNNFYNNRLIQAIQFGQKLVIDCGYDQNMTRRENQYTAKQLMLLFADNRYNDDPFDIHYVNINKDSDLTKMFHKYVPTMFDKEFPMNAHEKSYLDLFPKEKLVYLTPHCREEMESFDHDAIYIVGAIVDKVNQAPLSLAKAKRENITMKKFPLDRYLQWGSGSGKSLTINQCVAILLDMKETGDWNYSLRHVPRRKLTDTTTFSNSFKPSYNNSPKSFPSRKKGEWKPKSKVNARIVVKSLYDD
ncbi:unnamed protein product [Ceutorhynchus assimilis]|uniref:RNA (guanine-9-)-methyltransferase domain-containing protein 1 n=1 Tax=Ceutorhynchus assimilis TaxID=467358 RepID=A0A9N9QJC9_9CUCU|nr:unnamed protein product [Ceutorhynchus assimilis]